MNRPIAFVLSDQPACLERAGEVLSEFGFGVEATEVVPKEKQALEDAVQACLQREPRLIVVCGGTGLGPDDASPQVLDELSDYHAPGFGELIRAESLQYSRNAYLSRCGGWVKGKTLLLAVAGSPKAAGEHLAIVGDLAFHAVSSLEGKCGSRRRKESPG